MGLIKAAFGAAGGVMADQWKEFFYCEAIPADVLAVKGKKKVGETIVVLFVFITCVLFALSLQGII